MGKKYNLGSSSDMRRFAKDLEKDVLSTAKDQISNSSFDATCPECGENLKVHSGLNVCRFCGHRFNVDLKFNF